MKKFQIGFSKAKSKYAIGSSLIRWYMGTEYSHTYMIFNFETYSMVFHATGKGLFPLSKERFLEHNIPVETFEISVTDEEYLQIRRLCFINMGLDYGFWQNIGNLIADLLEVTCKKFNIQKRIVNPFMDGVNCSEWIAYIIKIKDPEVCKSIEINRVKPNDIYNYLIKKHNNLSHIKKV